MKKRNIGMIILVIFLIILDQVTKLYGMSYSGPIIENVLQCNHIENTGMAFGIGSSDFLMVIVSNIVVLGIIIRFMLIQKDRIDNKTDLFLCMVLAGGFSNLIDRFTKGYVIDYIQIFPNLNLPMFNLADIFIVVGWVFLAMIVAKNTLVELKKIKGK